MQSQCLDNMAKLLYIHRMNKRTTPTAFRLSEKGRALLIALSEKHGVNQTSVIEMAIREKAERDKVEVSPTEKKDDQD